MKAFLQWTLRTPADWITIDTADWLSLPKKPEPDGTEILDDAPGWIYTVSIQGLRLVGDAYALIHDQPTGGCTAYFWNNDPEDYTSHQFYAHEIQFLPLAPDVRFGGAYNTRQTRIVYAAPGVAQRFAGWPDVRPWSEFRIPPQGIVRYGKWLTDAQSRDHVEVKRQESWKEWSDGVPPTELTETGLIKTPSQR